MGMFDSFVAYDAAAGLVCSAGHPLVGVTFQSKDFDDPPSLDTYILYEGRLFREGKREEATGYALAPEGDVLVRTERYRAPACAFTGEVLVYTSCRTCLPVLFESTSGYLGDRVQERHPWTEYRLTFHAGRLERVEPHRLESREDVRRELQRELGDRVLDDDDRVARRHFKLRRPETDDA